MARPEEASERKMFSRITVDKRNCQGNEVNSPILQFWFHTPQYHSVTLQSLKNTPLFKCLGYCRFEDCPINVTVEVTDEFTLKAAVQFTGGDVCHSTTELKRSQCVQIHVYPLEKLWKPNYPEVSIWIL